MLGLDERLIPVRVGGVAIEVAGEHLGVRVTEDEVGLDDGHAQLTSSEVKDDGLHHVPQGHGERLLDLPALHL